MITYNTWVLLGLMAPSAAAFSSATSNCAKCGLYDLVLVFLLLNNLFIFFV